MTDPKNEAATLVDAFDAAARDNCYAEAQALRDYVARLAAEPAADDVEKVIGALGGMIAFPTEENIGVSYDVDNDAVTRATLNDFMENTWISDRWPALLRHAAETAVAALSRAAPSSGHAMAEGATASQLVEKWELEYMACRDDHWGDSIAWQGAREIARRIDAERTPPTTNEGKTDA